ncbi:unnamed protein product [Owenia fusiformis]|uniref:Uncharacterized protein n=1 Tax=Owenia fusiformis TaxID=6347 RepID=A0A8J1THA2_OWEFU|nr:unnamed protein product [Owenia fusiformis]
MAFNPQEYKPEPTAPPLSQAEAPPSYDDSISNPAVAGAAAAAIPGVSPMHNSPVLYPVLPTSQQPRYRLAHKDFLPKLLKKHTFSADEYEPFSLVMQHVNNWLSENPVVSVVQCQSLVWPSTLNKQFFTDQAIHIKSRKNGSKTKCTRGLRLWYYADSPHSRTPSICIGYRNFLPEPDEKLSHLVGRVNRGLNAFPLEGNILNVETVPLKTSSAYKHDPALAERSVWLEQPEDGKRYALFLRIFFIHSNHYDRDAEIVMKDFIPVYNQKSKQNAGYELFNEVLERASRWISHHDGYKFINLQSIPMKDKNIMEMRGAPVVEKCFFTEHGCSVAGATNGEATMYFQILRVIFVKPMQGVTNPTHLSVRTFVPMSLPEVPDTYEELTQTVDRVNSWISSAGATVFGMETVPIRLSPTLPMSAAISLGSDLTYTMVKAEEACKGVEKWAFIVRLYLSGDYAEPGMGTPIPQRQTSMSSGVSGHVGSFDMGYAGARPPMIHSNSFSS